MPVTVVKPAWVLHPDDKERATTIYTLAIHPDGSRLATGGLDTKIRIWSTAPIVDEAMEKNEKVPKLLCTMTSHSGVVMCVRWSHGGRYLASGSDDNIVMIWTLETGAGGKVWGSTETNVENWKAVRRLVGHDSDVAGVAWSSDDNYLASVGLDSTVLIWSGRTFELVRRLDGHQGFVKGVVFDPVGQYLATQSDDNSVKIWRTEDWGLEADIRAPFLKSPKTNLSRLSWSPEGTHIVTPNSMNGPVFVAAVIDRQKWTSNNSLVGHENVIEVTAFNPLIFLRDPAGGSTGVNLCTLLAVSARSSISLWVTSQSQPLVVLDEVFDRDILDLSWSSDGTQLWASSSEGHVAVFIFSLSDFNAVAPPGTREAYHKTFNFLRRTPLAPLGHQSLAPSSSASSLSTVGTMAQPNTLIARKGPGAKRRVVPVPVPQPVARPPPPPQPIHPIASTSAFEPNAFQPPIQDVGVSNAAWGGAVEQALPPIAAMTVPRKRKAGPEELQHQQQQQKQQQQQQQQQQQPRGDDWEDESDGVDPYLRVSKAGYRTKGKTLGENRERGPPKELRLLRPPYLPREKERTFEITNLERRSGKGLRVLAIPEVETFGTLQVEDSDEKDALEWRNFGEGEPGEGTSEVAVVTATKTLWVDYLPKYVVCGAGSPNFVAVSTEDGSLVSYSPAGRRLLPTMVLDSPCCFLEAEGPFLLAITALGSLSVWNTSLAKSLFPPLSISSLLTAAATDFVPHPEITTAALQPNGTPIIALSSGSTHSYDADLAAWTRLCEPWWSKGSDFWEARRGKANTTGRGIIRAIESAINDIVVDEITGDPKMADDDSDDDEEPVEKTVPEGDPAEKLGDKEMYRAAVSLGHLEVRMKAAAALDSPAELKTFLMAYAKRLAEEGYRSKAEELVKELLGPIYFKPGSENSWVPTVAGLNKRDLLKDVLSVFAKSKGLAALGSEYQDVLKKMNAA